MPFFKTMSKHYKVKSLQKKFDNKVAEVQALMAEKNIDASGKALLEAEQLRKEIEALNSDEE